MGEGMGEIAKERERGESEREKMKKDEKEGE